MKTLIKQARVINPVSGEDRQADLLVDGETIAQIAPSISDADADVIDAEGLWLLPGLVDVHVHLREPGNEGKETIATGTRAAAAGGVTSVVCMGNTNPPIDNKTGVDFILERVKETGCVRVYPVGVVTKGMQGTDISPFGEMLEAGAVALTDDGRSVSDPQVLRRAMEYSTIFGVPIISHAEDSSLTDGGHINDGVMSVKLGMIGSPREAESIHVARDLLLAKMTGAHLHIAHVSTADSVDLIRFYKKKGVHVTAEVTPHHLTLTEEAVEHFNTDAKMSPPLRTKEDQDALYEGIIDGTIDCIATDHAPHKASEKNVEFTMAPHGVIGLETLLPLLMGRIRERSGLGMLPLLSLVTDKPAGIMNLPGGKIEAGGPADLTLWNPEPVYVIDKSSFLSKSRNTPFDGWEVQGRVERTFAGGSQVYQYGNV